MPSAAVIDTSALIAAADRSDPDHAAAATAFRRRDLQLVIPILIIAEATYFLGRRFGLIAEAAFVRGLAALSIECPTSEDWSRIAHLIEQNRDFPLGTTDASIVAVAERLHTATIVTLDRRHFGTVRPIHVEAFHILPD